MLTSKTWRLQQNVETAKLSKRSVLIDQDDWNDRTTAIPQLVLEPRHKPADLNEI